VTAGKIRTAIVAERVAWVRKMLEATRNLPLGSYEQFQEDPRTPAAAESHLRRALERQRGSHIRFVHPDGRKTTIPDHGHKDIPRGLLLKIVRYDLEMDMAQIIELLRS